MIDGKNKIDIQNSLSIDNDEINTNKSFMNKLKEKEKYYNTESNKPIKLIPKSERNNENNLENALAMFAKADKLKKNNNKTKNNERGFWDKLFSPFKCGETHDN